ncbi:HTH-type transcriptional regulator YofA [Paenibacillus sp. JJ-100]|uniref:LysR family transcriptional regulator n=1 Tax=Paenibacillus sp. JJ-100 TaxID=2974896 RepID=UPI0022FF82A9|nr:LysR family transcriptional regulator [Paenibacillus sp. JJ-100]CAI6085157.1 HTH-type transcriptional regulator YofA [Paenibacillus sp. JJ-100]
MDAGDLKIFQAVAREGSITKAAIVLNYVQSNVTTRIRQLEAQLQVPLFYRSNRGMILTPAGENLLGYADRILQLLNEAEQVTQEGGPPTGNLRLGSIETAASRFVTPLLAEYCACYPKVHYSLVTGGTHELNQKVIEHELHGAMVYGPVEHEKLNYMKIYDDEMVLIAKPGEDDISVLLRRPMLFFEVGCSHRTQAEDFLKTRGIQLLNVMEYGTLDTILHGVTAGLGVSLLPRSSVVQAASRGEVELVSLPDPYSRLEVGFVYARGEHSSSALHALVEIMTVLES